MVSGAGILASGYGVGGNNFNSPSSCSACAQKRGVQISGKEVNSANITPTPTRKDKNPTPSPATQSKKNKNTTSPIPNNQHNNIFGFGIDKSVILVLGNI